MNNGLGYKLANVPTITGLSSINADTVTADITNTDQLIVDGVDVSSEINNQKARIIVLENKTTGISYSDTGGIDLTTIDNNVTITAGKVLTVNGVDITSALTGITYSNVGAVDLTTIDNNVKITKDVGADQFTVSTNGTFVNPVIGDKAGILAYNDGGDLFIIQNQETSGRIQLRAVDAINAVKVVLDVSTSIFDTTTTTNPTIKGFTDPASSDSTSKVATTRWVQSAISGSSSSSVNISATIPPDIYYIPVVSGTGNQQLRSDLLLNYEIISAGSVGEITANLNGNAGTSNQIMVNNDNTGTTYALTFCAGGAAGYKGLFIDPTTTALTYQPSTGTLSGTIFTGSSVIVKGVSGVSTTRIFKVIDGSASEIGLNIVPNVHLGAYNPISTANDTIVFGTRTTIETQNLVLSSWSNTASGVRITPTSTIIGAGGTDITPTASINFSGTTVAVNGNPIVEEANIEIFNKSQPITVGNGASTVSYNIIMASQTLATTRNFTTGDNVIIGGIAGNDLPVAALRNTFVGFEAGQFCTGNYNTCIGYNAQVGTASGNNQISIGSTSDTMYIQGGFNLKIGALITASITLTTPLAQHYPVAMATTTRIITLPSPTGSSAVVGALITFKRRTNTTAFTIAAGAGTPFINATSITPTATFPFGAGLFQATFVCDGTNWACISQG